MKMGNFKRRYYLLSIWSIVFILFACEISAQKTDILTTTLPLEFDPEFKGNMYWESPINIIDNDESSYSTPLKEFVSDFEGMYFLLNLRRPIGRDGRLVDSKDYGTILKVQVRLVYSLFWGIELSRFSTLEAEGFVRRLENVNIGGSGPGTKIVEIIDVTKAQESWDFTNPAQWDEFALRFGSVVDNLSDGKIRLYEVQLLVTYIVKDGGTK